MNNDEEKAVDFCELGQSDFVAALLCVHIAIAVVAVAVAVAVVFNTTIYSLIVFRSEGFSTYYSFASLPPR